MQILGVDRSADNRKIKSAYRQMTKKFHPDVNKAPDAAKKYEDINAAVSVQRSFNLQNINFSCPSTMF